MTSIILTQKIIKHDARDLERLRRQQAAVSQETRTMVNVLKAILKQELSNKTCRLCLKAGGREIFNGGQDFDVALTIRYILGIVITENDGMPQHICEPCEVTVRGAARLKQTAEATQWRLQQEQEMVAASQSCLNVVQPQCSADGTDRWPEPCDANVACEWQCKKCQKSFRSQEKLRAHEGRSSCRDGFVCESCGRQMKFLWRLKRHRLTHTEERAHACAACPYRARSREALAQHARRHAGRRPPRRAQCPRRPPQHACPCGKAFTFRATLQNHIASQHNNAKDINCSFCGKAFSTRRMMLRHELRVHNRPKMRSRVLLCLRQELDT